MIVPPVWFPPLLLIVNIFQRMIQQNQTAQGKYFAAT